MDIIGYDLMRQRDPLLMETIRLLSQRIANLDPFYSKTACLNAEERTLIGYCKAYMIMYGEGDPLSRLMKEKLIPALEVIGIGKWPRGEVTDLGFKLSTRDVEEHDLSQSDMSLPSPEEIENVLREAKSKFSQATTEA